MAGRPLFLDESSGVYYPVSDDRPNVRDAIGLVRPGAYLCLGDSMSAKLDKTIKRELDLDGKLYTVTISPEGVKITSKGARKGPEMSWQTLLSGDAELNRDLNISVDAYKS